MPSEKIIAALPFAIGTTITTIIRYSSALLTLLCLLVLLGPSNLEAQNAAVRGFVTDQSNGESLPGVNVILEKTDTGRRYGAASNVDGFFAVPRLPSGTYSLRASILGFNTLNHDISLGPGELRLFNIELIPRVEQLDEVTAESERSTGSANTTAGFQRAQAKDLKRIPTLTPGGDLASYLPTLPSIVSSSDQGGQLFVRGGEASQNLVMIDNMLVYQPFHVLGFFSAFPADIINRVDIYAGGFGAQYGGRLSSVIDIHSRKGNKQRTAGAISMAPFLSSARIEGPIDPSGKLSVLATGRWSFVEQFGDRLISESLPFVFGDSFVKFHADIDDNKQISITSLQSYDKGSIGSSFDLNSRDEVSWRNGALGFRYLFLPRRLPFIIDFSSSVSNFSSKFGDLSDPIRTSEVRSFNTSVNVTQFLNLVDVKWGFHARTLHVQSKLDGLFQGLALQEEWVTEVGAFIEPDVKIGERLLLTPSLRIQAFPSRNRQFMEPRFRGVFKEGGHQVSLAAGIYHQELIGINDRRDAANVFTAWSVIPFGDVPEAIHLLGGYRYRWPKGLEGSVELFYKKLNSLSVPEWTAYPRFTTRLQPADGNVLGFDLRVEYDSNIFYGSLSYGLTKVEYNAQQETLQLWFNSTELSYNPPHDRRHQITALGTAELFGLTWKGSWQFGTGFPFNQATGFDGFVLLDEDVDVFTEAGDRRVIYEEPYGANLPAYHRLDLVAEKTFTHKRARYSLQGGFINAYDRANIFFLDVFTLARKNQLPIIPTFGINIEFE